MVLSASASGNEGSTRQELYALNRLQPGTRIASQARIMGGNAPGKSTRQMALRRYLIRIALVVIGLCVLFYIGQRGLSVRNIGQLGLIVVALVCVDQVLNPVLDHLIHRERQAVRGAEAEERVGAILNHLPEDCEVLHDIVSDHGNIDHLVFRRDGAIILIETKSHGGTISESNAQKFLKQTHGNIFWLRDFLKSSFGLDAWINASIVFPNAHVSVRRKLKGVDFLNLNYLEHWMTKVPGSPQIAVKLWEQRECIKAELQATEKRGFVFAHNRSTANSTDPNTRSS